MIAEFKSNFQCIKTRTQDFKGRKLLSCKIILNPPRLIIYEIYCWENTTEK